MTRLPRHSNATLAKRIRRAVARGLSRLLPRAASQSAPLPVTGIHRILICRSTKTLGETLLLLPLVRELEIVYPGAELDLVTRCGAAAELFAGYDQVRTIHVLPARMLRQPWRLWKQLRRVRAVAYDLAIDPYLLSHSDRLLLRLARTRYTLGFEGSRKRGHVSHAIEEPVALQHAAKLPVYLLRRALDPQYDQAYGDYPLLDIRLGIAERERGAAAIARVVNAIPTQANTWRGVIGVYAHATGSKNFDRQWWSQVLAIVQARFANFAIVEILPMFAKSLLGECYPTYYASDVRRLAAAISQLQLFVSADCGVMHLASASGSPTIGVFSVTDIPGWSVYGPDDRTIDARDRTARDIATEIVVEYAKCLDPAT